MRKIILKQSQSAGDIMVFTAAIKAISETYPDWKIDVRTPCPEIFENNPRLTRLDEKDSTVEIVTLSNDKIHHSGMSGLHYCAGFVAEAEEKLSAPLKYYHTPVYFENEFQVYHTLNGNKYWSANQPEIWLREEEKVWVNQVRAEFGYSGKFWLINAGYKPECPLKWYPFYQDVVYLLRDKIQFVQVGHKDHVHPALEGVFNLVGKTDLRQLIRLAYWSTGSVGPISFHMHLMSAFNKPCVVLAGGKEGPRWELYPGHRYLYTNGALDCASFDGCWKSKKEDCVNLTGGHPRCFTMIRPEDVANAILSYYNGGRLKF